MESEIMCEVGAWENFEVLEEQLTLDELFIIYESTMKRSRRLMEVVGAAMGADITGGGEDDEGQNLSYDQGAGFIADGGMGDINEVRNAKDTNLSYQGGDIGPADHAHFAYFQKVVEDE